MWHLISSRRLKQALGLPALQFRPGNERDRTTSTASGKCDRSISDAGHLSVLRVRAGCEWILGIRPTWTTCVGSSVGHRGSGSSRLRRALAHASHFGVNADRRESLLTRIQCSTQTRCNGGIGRIDGVSVGTQGHRRIRVSQTMGDGPDVVALSN